MSATNEGTQEARSLKLLWGACWWHAERRSFLAVGVGVAHMKACLRSRRPLYMIWIRQESQPCTCSAAPQPSHAIAAVAREVEVLASSVALAGRASCAMLVPVGGAAMLGAPFPRAEVDATLELHLLYVAAAGLDAKRKCVPI